MPTPYTGDPTATQAPSLAPSPGGAPVADLPVDGDPPNGATFAQAYKVLADFIAFVLSPFGVIGSWAQALWRFGNAKKQAGHVINHQGILDGRVLVIEEDWIPGDDQGPATAFGNWFGRWKYGIFGSGGSVFASPAATNLGIAPWGPRGGVTIIGGVFPFNQSAAVIEMRKAFMRGGAAYICMEAAISVNPNGAGTLDTADTYSIGFSSGTLVSSADAGPCDTGAMASNAGAYLVKGAGGSTWGVISRPVGGGGSGTSPVATVAADTPVRYRVEIISAGAADDSAVHVIHYVDGAIVADHAVDMNGAALTPFIRTAGQYSGPNVHSVLNVGRVRLTARLELGDVYP